jgi:elongation factor G
MSAESAHLRNIAFVGHPSSGKTTLIEAMAFALSATERKGAVKDKTSVLDTEPEEHDRGHTLKLTVLHAKKDGIGWNLIDTPGYPEFMADTLSGIFAAELTVGVVSCTSGPTFNLREKMAKSAELGRGRAIVVTHIDAENADFDELVEDLRSALGEVCVPVVVPNESAGGFNKVVSQADPAWRKVLFDRVMDACDDEATVMEYLETETLSDEALHKHLPVAIAKGTLVPVFACHPERGIGIPELLTFLREYAPQPLTRTWFRSESGAIEVGDGELLGVVFNVKTDPHVGKICLACILHGTLKATDIIGDGRGEKLGGLFHLVGGKNRVSAESVSAGDIAAFSKVESLGWGQAFSLHGSKPVKVVVPALPEPMVALAVQPKSRNDEQKIGHSLAKLAAEDPTLKIVHEALTHELILRGMSDLHLQVAEMRLKRRFGVEVTTSLPRIAYRETITRPAEGHHRHKKQTGGRGQFGECYLRVHPGAQDSGVVFVDKVVGGAIPRNLIPAVEKGVMELAAEGILTHSRVVDLEVEVYDGKFHAVDSDEASFKKAGFMAFRDAFMKAGPVLLEPVVEIEIRLRAKDAGSIFSDLTSHRRGTVVDQSSEQDGAVTVIRAHAPLATMQAYHRDLKSQTAGEGSFSMKLHHYARVPAMEQEKIIASVGKRHVEEE